MEFYKNGNTVTCRFMLYIQNASNDPVTDYVIISNSAFPSEYRPLSLLYVPVVSAGNNVSGTVALHEDGTIKLKYSSKTNGLHFGGTVSYIIG